MTTDALRGGLAEAVAHHLPAYRGPVVTAPVAAFRCLRPLPQRDERCGRSGGFGVTSGLNTTMIYLHVDKTHIEQAWAPPVAGPLTGSEAVTCRSSNRIVTGRPDHRWRHLPRADQQAGVGEHRVQVATPSRHHAAAAAIRRFHFIVIAASEPVNGPTTGDGPGLFDVGLVDMHVNHRGVQPLVTQTS